MSYIIRYLGDIFVMLLGSYICNMILYMDNYVDAN